MPKKIIDAEELEKEMWYRCGISDDEIHKGRAKWDSGLWIRYKIFEECIADIPSINAELVNHATWDKASEDHDEVRTCSNCHWITWFDEKHPLFNYCPCCGSKMSTDKV